MRIIVNFLSGSEYWESKIKANAEEASRRLSDPAFLAWVKSWSQFDFSGDTPLQVSEKLAAAGDVKINVGFYSKLLTLAIAYEEDDAVFFNTRKESYGAGGVGNIAHEVMHAMGYSHNGNSARGNENTVPYRIGEWIETWVLRPVAPEPETVET